MSSYPFLELNLFTHPPNVSSSPPPPQLGPYEASIASVATIDNLANIGGGPKGDVRRAGPKIYVPNIEWATQVRKTV